MMVGDDDVDPDGVCPFDSRVAAGSAIGGNDKIDASRHRHLVDMIGFETVAFLYAMGDVIGHIRSGFQ